MLLDTLAIIIGFVTIVLLLSILVTALVQTAANLMRRRHKALDMAVSDTGIVTTLGNLRPQVAADPNADTLVDQAIATVKAANLDPRVTWLEDKDVLVPLEKAGIPASGIAVARHALDHTRRIMEDKYLQWSRGLTVAASVLVAAIFGASTPHLLERLRDDAEFRVRAEAAGEQLVRDTPDQYRSILTGSAGLRARTRFLESHPQFVAELGALRFEVMSVDDLVANFETAMDSEPDRDQLAEEFRGLLEEELAAESARSMEAARRAVSDLEGLGIEPLEDLTFYFERSATGSWVVHWRNIFGVLFTAVLMSFGAPFWYRALRELVGLKDALRKKVPPAPQN